MPPTTTAVRLPVAVIAKIRALAAAHDRSIAAELRVALNDYIARHEKGETT
jgi:plasmid stability protein